ncbi:MAG: replication initiation factor domain-containing protein [Lautropia sp.]|nr:replication initiation factor domain-containing protein [Lautropia sp.]
MVAKKNAAGGKKPAKYGEPCDEMAQNCAETSPPSGGDERSGQGSTPSSNHGVKVPYEVLTVADLPPLENPAAGHGGRLGRVLDMAVTEPDTGARLVASVDWISCTLPEQPGWRSIIDEAVLGICDVREGFVENERGFLGYEHSGRYGPVVVAWGGKSQRQTVYLSIPGTVAGALSAHKLAQLAVFLEKSGARLTRLDCAVDDYDGKFLSIAKVRRWYREGRFISNGRPPKATFISDEGNGTGSTFYVGSRNGGKFLRVYEKGKQMGDPSSPWVRVEVQLGNKLRELPWEGLSRPADVLAGTYPALDAVSRAPLSVNMYYVKSRKHGGYLPAVRTLAATLMARICPPVFVCVAVGLMLSRLAHALLAKCRPGLTRSVLARRTNAVGRTAGDGDPWRRRQHSHA